MKKVGIITLNGYFNYGNRLQNYALQELIKSLGFEVETIINDSNFKTRSNNKKNMKKKLKELNLEKLVHYIDFKLKKYSYFKNKLDKKRTKLFKEFSRTYIKETDFSISEDRIPKDFSQRYDYFITGSDQVWNPVYKKGTSIEFLTFAPQEKRIAYAPSFGISKIPEEYVERFSQWLSEMPYISVREEAGAKIIKELTGRDVPIVLDPTMMLTKEKWLSISKIPSNKPMKNYLLTYFLGKIPKNREKFLREIAKKNDLEIVNLSRVKDKIPYLTDPSEFIDYINTASVLCTDSFHGAVFSILLETPFIVFDRIEKYPSMSSRIDTLLKTFKLESRAAVNVQSNKQIFEVDYSHTKEILEEERKKSLTYLKKALNAQIN